MQEIWKDIPGYEGRYQVSNLGKFKRVERITTWLSRGVKLTTRKDPEKIIEPEVGNSGYLTVRLFKDGRKKRVNLHRLIALAFLPNPENKPCINHKDGVRTNNNITNLEWCTYSENNYHEWRVLKKKSYNAKKVKRLDTGAVFNTITAAAASISVHKTTLCDALKRNGTCGGIKWQVIQ